MNEDDILVYCSTKPTPKKRRRVKNRSEQALQISAAQFLDLALPESAVWWHTPNGSEKSRAVAGIYKAMGLKPGVPDITILWGSPDGMVVITIELKSESGALSQNQREMRDRLISIGCAYLVTSNLENIEDFLLDLGVPLKASLGASTTSKSSR